MTAWEQMLYGAAIFGLALMLRWVSKLGHSRTLVVPSMIGDAYFGVSNLLDGEVISAAFNAAAVALLAHYWWNNGKRRGRKASRVVGVVKDLGHRLTVVPAPPATDV